jgi:hypothetical protein
MKRLYISTLFILIFAVTSFAGKVERASEKVSTTEAKIIEIDGELGAGKFTISTEDIPELALFDIAYDKKAVKYYVDYYERGETGFLTFESDRRKSISFDTEENRWDIVLSNKYESKLDLSIGACDAKIDLGGLPLRELSINFGAASGIIEFSKPNSIRLEEFRLDAGASSLDLQSIGNANFSRFEFSGGVGSFKLDFRGEYKGESEIYIEIGLGSADITLPIGVPVRVISADANWLSSVDFHNDDLDEVDDGEYESAGFAKAKDRIVLKLEVGLGSVDLFWKN